MRRTFPIFFTEPTFLAVPLQAKRTAEILCACVCVGVCGGGGRGMGRVKPGVGFFNSARKTTEGRAGSADCVEAEE